MHLLIPYVRLSAPDPAFDEYTYGDVGWRARKLKSDLKKGDYVFFHTTRKGKKCITGYYAVDRVLDTANACRYKEIRAKYRNPHIADHLANKHPPRDDDAIVFGDPITSRVLERPLLFDRKLAQKLSLKFKFSVKRSDAQVIVSATRQWRELTEKDRKLLLKEIGREQKAFHRQELLSTNEVAEMLERDIERFIAHNPSILRKGLTLSRQQRRTGEGRLDLLFEDKQGDWVVVELKLNQIGREAVKQLKTYIHDLREETGKRISPAIVCAGVMPAYENELAKRKDVRIFVYGWNLKVVEWHPSG